jgi:hypothetical protein
VVEKKLNYFLDLGFLPVAKDLPVWDWAIRAALPGEAPLRLMAS